MSLWSSAASRALALAQFLTRLSSDSRLLACTPHPLAHVEDWEFGSLGTEGNNFHVLHSTSTRLALKADFLPTYLRSHHRRRHVSAIGDECGSNARSGFSLHFSIFFYNLEIAPCRCRKAVCAGCHKATWLGCGQHIDSCLAGVAEADRCPAYRSLLPAQSRPAVCPGAPASAPALTSGAPAQK